MLVGFECFGAFAGITEAPRRHSVGLVLREEPSMEGLQGRDPQRQVDQIRKAFLFFFFAIVKCALIHARIRNALKLEFVVE